MNDKLYIVTVSILKERPKTCCVDECECYEPTPRITTSFVYDHIPNEKEIKTSLEREGPVECFWDDEFNLAIISKWNIDFIYEIENPEFKGVTFAAVPNLVVLEVVNRTVNE